MNICIDCRNSWQNDTDNSGDFLTFLLCAQTSPVPAGSWQPAPVGCDARTGNWCFFSWFRHSSSKLQVLWLLERPRSATLKLSPHVCLFCVLAKQPESRGARWQWWNLCKAVWIVAIAAAAAFCVVGFLGFFLFPKSASFYLPHFTFVFCTSWVWCQGLKMRVDSYISIKLRNHLCHYLTSSGAFTMFWELWVKENFIMYMNIWLNYWESESLIEVASPVPAFSQ